MRVVHELLIISDLYAGVEGSGSAMLAATSTQA